MKYVILAAVLIGVCSLSESKSYACSCVKPEVPQAFDEARAVFTGEVTEIIEPRTDDPKAPLAARLYCPGALVKTMHLRCKTLVATHIAPC
jgi:hypothetical protein